MAINEIHSVFNFLDVKCYCESTNEKNRSNGGGIMCGKNGLFAKTSHCGLNEICIGPSKASEAVFERENVAFCVKGTLKLM